MDREGEVVTENDKIMESWKQSGYARRRRKDK